MLRFPSPWGSTFSVYLNVMGPFQQTSLDTCWGLVPRVLLGGVFYHTIVHSVKDHLYRTMPDCISPVCLLNPCLCLLPLTPVSGTQTLRSVTMAQSCTPCAQHRVEMSCLCPSPAAQALGLLPSKSLLRATGTLILSHRELCRAPGMSITECS